MSEEKTQKFDPVREFVSLRDNLTKAVGQTLKVVNDVIFPAVDVYETDQAVIIRTEPLIGVDVSQVEVSMEDDLLIISGETKDDLIIDDAAFIQRELSFGPFKREIRIPRRVRSSEAKASFKQGILKITLPKEQSAGTQIVDVTPAE